MTNAVFHYLALQVLIWMGLTGWIYFVAKLGEWKVERERKKGLGRPTLQCTRFTSRNKKE